MKLISVLCLSFVTLMGCSEGTASPSVDRLKSEPISRVSRVVISDARIRPPLPGRDVAVAYFRLDSVVGDRLVSVASPVSDRVEIHNHIDDNGILRMRKINSGVTIPVNGSVEFQPGGYHIMLFNVALNADTQDVALTFDFETNEDITVIADVAGGDSHTYGSGKSGNEDDKTSYGSGH
ncbi:MAG: copper chaperone PCu(A)C [Maricaulaceae bacterium]